MCKISIIVPLYNGEKTIERCLDSLVNQTLKDIEIIVVNDGSKDNGGNLVKQYIEKDSRIRLVSQNNAGLGAARNHGIREARGKYVGFVDCDDFVDLEMYEIMVNAIEKAKVSIAICQEKNVYIENENIEFINETQFPTKRNTVYSQKQIIDWFLNFSYLSLNSMCYKVIEKSLFNIYGIMVPEKYRHAEDLVTSAALFSNVNNVVIVPRSLYYYVHSKKSISYNYSLQHAIDIYYDWKEVKEFIGKSNYSGTLDNFSLGMEFTSLKQLYWAKNKQDKNCNEAKKLKKVWKKERKKGSWRPVFKGVDIPGVHKIKVYSAYFHMERVVCFLLRTLRWIPFFNFMT